MRPVRDDAFEAELRARIDGKTKPVGALGRIEDLAAQVARATGSLEPAMRSCQLTIFAADHGLAAAGVSAYPPAVTRQMLVNFLGGNAAANVFARVGRRRGAGGRCRGLGRSGPPPGPRRAPDRRGHAQRAARAGDDRGGARRGRWRPGGRSGATAPGTRSASARWGSATPPRRRSLAHKATGLALEALVGRGTGLDDAGLARKRRLLAEAAARTPERLAAPDALAEYGGFEIAMMAGAMLGAAAAGRVVIVDGFIAGAAALVALDAAPEARRALVFAHRSAEHGHSALLGHFGAVPLLDLDMRLGEGTGALLAWPLVRAAAAMLREMASFESAGISGPA